MPWKTIKPGSKYILRRTHKIGFLRKKEEILRLKVSTAQTEELSQITIKCFNDNGCCFYGVVLPANLLPFVKTLGVLIEKGEPAPPRFPAAIFWQPLLVALTQIMSSAVLSQQAAMNDQIDGLTNECIKLQTEIAEARLAKKLLEEIKNLVEDYDAS